MAKILYILYNADASWAGKLQYGYRKLTSAKDRPACAACDITHGGLHLDETAEWKRAKEDIVKSQQLELKQLHRDELDANVGSFQTQLTVFERASEGARILADIQLPLDQDVRRKSRIALSHGLIRFY